MQPRAQTFDGLYEPGYLDRLRADERAEKDWAAFSEALGRPAHADPTLARLLQRSRPA